MQTQLIHSLLQPTLRCIGPSVRVRANFSGPFGTAAPQPLCPNPVIWTAAHSVGVDEIDEQHILLARLIDNLSATLRDGADQGVILTQLEALIQYTEFHFGAEELLMAEYGGDNILAHREAHRRLLDDIRKLVVTNDWVSISLILRYLREWLLRHVDGFDKRLAVGLIAKGYKVGS